jgi:hypothetical protein
MCFFSIVWKFFSCVNRGLFSSSLSKINITSLHCLITFFKLDYPFVQYFRTLLSNLNFAEIFAALFEALTSLF